MLGDSASPIRRRDVFIQSKYSPWAMHRDPTPYEQDDEIPLQVLKSFAKTLKNLHLDLLDVYFLHTPMQTMAQTQSAWKTMEQIADWGAVRSLGICQVGLQCLTTIVADANIRPSFAQNRFTKQNTYDREVRSFCSSNEIVYQAYGIFSEENQDLLQSSVVKDFAEAQFVTSHMALISLLLANAEYGGLQMCIVDGTRDDEHSVQNVKTATHRIPVTRQMADTFSNLLKQLLSFAKKSEEDSTKV